MMSIRGRQYDTRQAIPQLVAPVVLHQQGEICLLVLYPEIYLDY